MNPYNIQDTANKILTLLFDIDHESNPAHVKVGEHELDEAILTVVFVLTQVHAMKANYFSGSLSKERYIKKSVKLFRSILTKVIKNEAST